MDKNKDVDYSSKKVCYIFRSKTLNQFSIENVFKYIKNSISDDFKIDEAYVPYGRIKIKEVLANLIFARKIKADILHITGDIHYISAVLPKKSTVLTIHDLVGFYNYKNPLKKIIYYLLWFLLPSIKCKYITVISNKTKKDFLKICPWAKKKTYVIPDPISPSFQYSYKEFCKKRPKILLVGTSSNKNHARVIEALKDLDCELIIVGKIPSEEITLLEKAKISYSNFYKISEEEIIKLYLECDILLFPSLYEGFGMPIIEGQKTGRCVITSYLEPMSDVAGSGACLVNPYDVRDIREKILKVIQDDCYRNEVITAGLKNSEKYTAREISKSFEQIYNMIDV